IGRTDEAVDIYQKAIALFEKEGAVGEAAETSIALAMIQGWRNEVAAGMRTTERALKHLGSAEPHLKMDLLAMRAMVVSVSGDAVTAASLLDEASALRNGAEGPRLTLTYDHNKAFCRYQSTQWEQAVTEARQVAETYRTMGDLWNASNAEAIVGFE